MHPLPSVAIERLEATARNRSLAPVKHVRSPWIALRGDERDSVHSVTVTRQRVSVERPQSIDAVLAQRIRFFVSTCGNRLCHNWVEFVCCHVVPPNHRTSIHFVSCVRSLDPTTSPTSSKIEARDAPGRNDRAQFELDSVVPIHELARESQATSVALSTVLVVVQCA